MVSASTLRLGLALLLAAQANCQQCTGQSCVIANIAGNSGVPVDINQPPVGDTVKGDCCVIKYNPAVTELAYQFRPELKTACAKYNRRGLELDDDLSRKEFLYKRSIESMSLDIDIAAAEEEMALTKRAACSPKTLIYAKGTFEPGPLGVTIGPKLKDQLTASAKGVWSVQGVNYEPSIAGDYCLGLPGGVEAKKLLQKVASDCPSTKIYLGGYSQGAMVVRNGLGNSTVQSRVKGVVTFGDPFNGSPIKGYSGKIQTYCDGKDGVCSGNFEISGAHLSYSGNVGPAVKFLNSA